MAPCVKKKKGNTAPTTRATSLRFDVGRIYQGPFRLRFILRLSTEPAPRWRAGAGRDLLRRVIGVGHSEYISVAPKKTYPHYTARKLRGWPGANSAHPLGIGGGRRGVESTPIKAESV